MRLAPRIVMVIVHRVGHGPADDRAHALDPPFAARMRIAAGELHRRDVAAANLGIFVDHGGRHVHAVLAAGRLEVARGAGVAEAAAAEMYADPDKVVLVAHQIDIVIAGADGAELRDRFLPVRLHVGLAPGVGIVEQGMLGTLLVTAADAERDSLGYIPDDRPDAIRNGRELHVKLHCHVAAADVEPDARDADLLLISDYAAD